MTHFDQPTAAHVAVFPASLCMPQNLETWMPYTIMEWQAIQIKACFTEGATASSQFGHNTAYLRYLPVGPGLHRNA
jgi:hypothetical protein